MNSALFHLNWKEVGVSAVGAVLSAVVKVLYVGMQGGSFNPATYNWSSLGTVAIGAFLAFLLTLFSTDQTGHVLGIGTPKSE